MSKQFLRAWQAFQLDEIKKHLLIIGDSVGDCSNCRELGIDIKQTAECPKCRTPFKYVASRRAATHPGERFQLPRRILELRPHLIVIDYEDYQKVTGSQKARDFFNSANG